MTERQFDVENFKQNMTTGEKVKAFFYPETWLGGYTRKDGTVEFFARINTVISENDVLLDFGAGRGAWTELDTSPFRRSLRSFSGKVKTVIACDVDEVVLQNKASDRQFVIKKGEKLPLDDHSIDVIVMDWVLEHIDNPEEIFGELNRILKPGGWICARTPNKYGYIAVLTRLIKNKFHSKVLQIVQPERKEIDAFPTVFKVNSMTSLNKICDNFKLQNYSYRYSAEPAYYFNSKVVFLLLCILDMVIPRCMLPNLMVFLNKP